MHFYTKEKGSGVFNVQRADERMFKVAIRLLVPSKIEQ